MNQRSERQILLEVAAVLVIVVAQLYMTDADFKYAIDARLTWVRQWWRRRRWLARHLRRPGWAQEAVEQVHGRP